ncbi:MAG: phosphoribosylformylglycinamidine synthase subunit PurQ, partial [Clostridia bacterium]|nr:phosphoribosylformylglycinamidine synthase subunit PurQ [Clostridia bacterium]
SHGEGRLIADEKILSELAQNGQIATQYVDENGIPSLNPEVTPNGSLWAIEGITSPDGRILGKMGHSERVQPGVLKNIPGQKFQPIFKGGVDYFK